MKAESTNFGTNALNLVSRSFGWECRGLHAGRRKLDVVGGGEFFVALHGEFHGDSISAEVEK